jgi:DNA-binding response OmpR family regulator
MLNAQYVLYVEDEPLIRELTATVLREAGFEIVVAENGDAALAALDGDADPFRAVVTDVSLGPGPDGWRVAKRARELNHALPVVYVSGANAHEWQSKSVPASVMITKPYSPERIVTVISSLLRIGGR